MSDEQRTGGAADVNPDIIFRDIAVEQGDKPFLGSIDGVDMVVRALAKRVQEFRGAYLETGRAPERPTAFVEKAAKAMTDIFFGRSADYAFTPWNSPEQLGYGFGDRVGIEGEPEDVMNAYWHRFIADLIAIMQEHEGGLDDEQAKFQLDVKIEEAVYALLGLPLSAD